MSYNLCFIRILAGRYLQAPLSRYFENTKPHSPITRLSETNRLKKLSTKSKYFHDSIKKIACRSAIDMFVNNS